MAVPATVVAGIGGVLYWQETTGNWNSWAYTWTLIPGFVGLGIILEALLEGKPRGGLRAGGSLMVISAILFVIFASFMGGPALLGTYWPVLLILIGLWFIIRSLLRRG
jgi:peptidoglycan/LPS O-acetylase OafA/YrhL